MTEPIRGISSKATGGLLSDLARMFEAATQIPVAMESVGGVDAAKRVQAGEPFDVVVLDATPINTLIASGRIVADSRVDLVRSPVVAAVREGAARPDISSVAALRNALLAASSIGYSTGPSGVALMKLIEQWGIATEVHDRLLQAPPGIPVGQLVAEGRASLGFQQYSELMNVSGITILGVLPPGAEIVSTFTAGLCASSTQPQAARDFIAFLASSAAADVKRRYGMEPA